MPNKSFAAEHKKPRPLKRNVRRKERMTKDRSAIYDLEEGNQLQLDFGKMARAVRQCPDVIPVAVQNVDTMEIILVAYTNWEAFEQSVRTRVATFWSTSRNELWIKGKGSGNTFKIVDIRVNCEQNSLVYIVKQNGGGICHTKNSEGKARECYYRRFDMESGDLENLDP